MHSSLFSRVRFALQRYINTQPIAALCLGTAAFLAALSAALWWGQIQRGQGLRDDLNALRQKSRAAPALAKKSDEIPPLPVFRSSELVGALQHAGTGSGLAMNEISYSLDASAAQPYLRYQVSLSVVGAYPVVRRFIDDIVLEMPNLVLDSIACSRDDIAAARPVCDLSFSSFYRKDING